MLQAEVKSLCRKTNSLLTAWHGGAAAHTPTLAPSARGHRRAPSQAPLPRGGAWASDTSQSEGRELSLPCQGWAVPAAAERRGRRTHAGNGILQQELGPLAPRSPLLLLQEAANRA